jgi:hypothetical protein
VATGTKLPTGGGKRRTDRPRTVLSAERLEPPPAPEELAEHLLAGWDRLWSLPVAALWREGEDGDAVARLCELRSRLADPEAPGWVFGAVQSLEDRLLLNPRARRIAGISYEQEPEPKQNGRPRMTSRERERLLRG